MGIYIPDDATDVILSYPEIKKDSWKKFEGEMERMLSNPKETKEELKELHFILTSKAVNYKLINHPTLEDINKKSLIVLDRDDGYEIEKKFREYCREREGKIGMDEGVTKLVELSSLNTEIEHDFKVSGELRSFGKRKIGKGEKHTVYAPHFYSACEEISNIFGIFTGYYGLSKGLPDVYNLLCDSFDQRMKNAKDQKEKLAAIAHFQMLGTKLIHPFIDGNGRAFGAHFILTTNRIGVEFEPSSGLYPDLEEISNKLLENTLKDADLGYVRVNAINFLYYVPALFFWHSNRMDYMSKLKQGIEKAILNWKEDPIKPCIEQAVPKLDYLVNNSKKIIAAEEKFKREFEKFSKMIKEELEGKKAQKKQEYKQEL